jgi:ABC-2 type transport system permease protein
LRLPDRIGPMYALLAHEIRCLLASKAFWCMLLVLAPLVGYGFFQAVDLFAQASKSALEAPELARGMSPLDGILVPTLGAFYLAVTLLFPFVAIRAIGQDKQSGAMKLSSQFPVGIAMLLATKIVAVGVAWGLSFIPALSAIAIWVLLGGHLYAPEVLNLLLGHMLYAVAVAGIAFLSAALADSVSTAAIIALALTLGSWVLDFAAAGSQTSWLQTLSQVSPTAALRQFERGLFSLPQALELSFIGAGLIIAAGICLQAWRPPAHKIGLCIGMAMLLAPLLVMAGYASVYRDWSEDHRNSFSRPDAAALARMDKGLHITLYLSPDDSRFKELEANMLAKLRRVVPHLVIRYAEINKSGLFGPSGDERYGLIVYEYAGKREESRSNSQREILPILYGLSGIPPPQADPPRYPGYPLDTDTGLWSAWFYLGLPALTLVFWWRTAFRSKQPSPRSAT